MERVETCRPLRLETLLLSERLGSCKLGDSALPLIKQTFEAELGATADNRAIVEIMPEGKKPPLKLFVNTTDKRKLYRELIRLCLEDAKKMSAEKQERIRYYFDEFQKQQMKACNEQPQQEKVLIDLLPEHLKTDENVKTFQRAIDKGFIKKTATGLEWKGGSKALLAYFLGKFLINGTFPEVIYSKLFNETRLAQANYKLADNKNGGGKPRGYEEIDRLFV